MPKEGDSSVDWSEISRRIGVKLNLERAESVQARFRGGAQRWEKHEQDREIKHDHRMF